MSYSDYFEIENGENQHFLRIILEEILNVFEQLEIEYDNQQRIIVGCMPCPRFCTKEQNPIPCGQIHLTVSDYSYWCQVIYQLSHELTHCFVYCHNIDDTLYASWFEETICESVSLFFLAYFRDHWSESKLFGENERYSAALSNYLDEITSLGGNNRLSNCRNYEELMAIDKTSQDKREDRKNEMLGLFKVLISYDIKGLICYKDYIIKDRKILDTERYCLAYPNNTAVKYLCDLQKCILS